MFSPNYDDVDDEREILNWRDVIRTGRIVYVGLDALTDVTVSGAGGSAMFSDLTSTAGDLYAHGLRGVPGETQDWKPICLHADEFNELIGDDFIPMLNKAGGAKFQVTAYTQTWSDVEARLGSKPKAEQVAGNLNTLIMMRVLSEETAKMLTTKLPKVQVAQKMLVSGAGQSSIPESEVHFTTSVQDRVTTLDVPMIEPGDLTRLPKGQAFVMTEGGTLYKTRLPLPAADDIDLPDTIAEMVESMRGSYQKAPQDWSKDSWWDYQIQPKIRQAVNASDAPLNADNDVRQRRAPFDTASTGVADAHELADHESSNGMSVEMM